MWTKIFFLNIIGLLSVHALADCLPTLIRRQLEPNNYKEESITVCDQKNGVHFSSPKCQKASDCISDPKTWKRRKIKSEIESPGFAACEIIGGKAHFIEIYKDKSWYKTDVCFVDKVNFLDNDRVYDYFKRN